jgi:hypothetical protein
MVKLHYEVGFGNGNLQLNRCKNSYVEKVKKARATS